MTVNVDLPVVGRTAPGASRAEEIAHIAEGARLGPETASRSTTGALVAGTDGRSGPLEGATSGRHRLEGAFRHGMGVLRRGTGD